MVATVSLERLDRVMVGRDPGGKRIYVANRVTVDDLNAIRRCVMIALGNHKFSLIRRRPKAIIQAFPISRACETTHRVADPGR